MSEYATLGGGCFWCTEAIFQEVRGVESVLSGYAGGTTDNPTYEQVCSGKTGHAEVVQLIYDENLIAYADLLRIHLATHNPTTLDAQGADVGTQYRSIIFTHNDEQRSLAAHIIQELMPFYEEKLVTEVAPFIQFFEAEIGHRNYYKLHKSQPYCQTIINSKLTKLRQQFCDKLRTRQTLADVTNRRG